MDQHAEEAVITARVTYDREADKVTVDHLDGTSSTHHGEAARPRTSRVGRVGHLRWLASRRPRVTHQVPVIAFQVHHRP